MIKLSICIPNYNRGAFIGETLQSAVDQAGAEVEIVISDNASTDNSLEVIAAFARRYPNIKYHRVEKNAGFDRNVLKVVELASGEYCWFLGSDDRLEPGAVQAVLAALATYPDLGGMSLGYVPYDRELRRPGVAWNPTLGRYDREVLFQDANECFSVLGHYFGFFSAQVVNRQIWREIFQTGVWEKYCAGFVHVFMIGSVLQQRPRWLFLPRICVGWRGGNDQLLQSVGFYERLRFDLEGCSQVFAALLGKNTRVYDKIMSTGAAVHTSAMVLNARLNNIDFKMRIKLAGLCWRYYGRYWPFWTNIIPILIAPVPLLRILRQLVRGYKKVRWSPLNGDPAL